MIVKVFSYFFVCFGHRILNISEEGAPFNDYLVFSAMDIIAQINETIKEIENTKTENNVKFANKLEKCVLTYYIAKAKSTRANQEDISLSFNLKVLHTKDDDLNQLEEPKNKNESIFF